MTIKKAIAQQRADHSWDDLCREPSSVDIGFVNRDGREDETQFDLYSEDFAGELSSLWKELHRELGAKSADSVTYVRLIGYVV